MLYYSEMIYSEIMEKEIQPNLKKLRKIFKFYGGNQKELVGFGYKKQNSKGTVILLHGFTETGRKYDELSAVLLDNNYSVVTYDQRGHGYSNRQVRDRALVHIERFEDYVDDFELFLGKIQKEYPPPYYLYAHSMGGAVAALYLEKGGRFFKKAILNAPMIAPDRGKLPVPVCKLVFTAMRGLGYAKDRCYKTPVYKVPGRFEESCATSRARFNWYENYRKNIRAYCTTAATYGWSEEAFNVTDKILKAGKVEKIRIPCKVYIAEKETVVRNKEICLFANRIPNKSIEVIRNAKHEIFRSDDSTLFPYWDSLLAFLKDERK